MKIIDIPKKRGGLQKGVLSSSSFEGLMDLIGSHATYRRNGDQSAATEQSRWYVVKLVAGSSQSSSCIYNTCLS